MEEPFDGLCVRFDVTKDLRVQTCRVRSVKGALDVLNAAVPNRPDGNSNRLVPPFLRGRFLPPGPSVDGQDKGLAMALKLSCPKRTSRRGLRLSRLDLPCQGVVRLNDGMAGTGSRGDNPGHRSDTCSQLGTRG